MSSEIHEAPSKKGLPKFRDAYMLLIMPPGRSSHLVDQG